MDGRSHVDRRLITGSWVGDYVVLTRKRLLNPSPAVSTTYRRYVNDYDKRSRRNTVVRAEIERVLKVADAVDCRTKLKALTRLLQGRVQDLYWGGGPKGHGGDGVLGERAATPPLSTN